MASRTSPWGEALSPRNRTATRKSPADHGPVEAGSEADKPRSGANQLPVRAGKTLPGVDGRSPWARRKRTIARAIFADLGGEGNVSTAERILVGKVATLEVQL